MKPRIFSTARLSFPLATALAALLAAPTLHAAALTWDANGTGALQTDGAGTWLTANQWWDGSANANWNNATPDDAIIGNGGAGGAITLGGSITAGTINLNNFTGTYTLQGTSQTLSTGGGITIGSTAGNVTLRGTGTSALLTLAGAGGITMNGTGVVNLRENMVTTYTGSTTINSGVVLLNAASKSTGNFNLNGGMVTDYYQQTGVFTGLGTGANQIQIHGDSGFGAGNGGSTWRIGTAASVLTWGGVDFDPTTLKLMTAADNLGPTIYGQVTLDNGLNLGGVSRTIDVLNASANPTTSGGRIGGVISNGSLVKTGGGNLTLVSNSNTYPGTTTITSGFLTVGASGGLGDGSATNTLIFNGGTLRASAAITSPVARSVTMTATGIIDSNGQAISIAGNIGGAGGLTKNSTGTLTLTGTNSFGGVTTVNAGTLAITKEISLASNTAANLNVKSGATLQLNVDSAGTAGFTSANLGTLLSNTLVANTAAQGLQAGATLAIDTSTATGATFTLSSAITNSTGAFGGAISLIKLGSGTLVVDQPNTNTGGTTISGGTLQLNVGGSIPGTLVNNGVLLVNKIGALTIGTDFPSNIGGSGSIAIGASSTLTISTPTQFQFSALNTTGGGSFILSGVTTPVFGGLSGTTGNLSSAFSSGYGSVTNLILNTPSGTTFTYAGVINDGATGMHITKTGAGTQILTGTNTYNGTTFLNGGTLQLGVTTTSGKIIGTTAIQFNGGTLQFNGPGSNADIDAIPNGAPITVNSSSTFGVTAANAGGTSNNETVGAVTLNAGQMNFNWTNGGSSGTIMTLTSVSRSGTASANFNSGFSTASSRWKVTSAGTTTGGQIIGPWYTTGGNNVGFASTDYAVYASDFVAQAAIGGSAETTWTAAANAYTTSAGGTVTLTGTRTITALRNTGATTVLTLASGANLETSGLLNGVATLLTVAPGTGGVLTTSGGAGNLYVTPGAGAITVSAPISGSLTLVKNGSNTLTLTSTTSNFSGGVVLNAGTLSFDDTRSIGGTNNTGGSTVPITVNGNATLQTVANTANANLGTGTITLNNGAILTFAGTSRGIHTVGGAVTGSGGVTFTTATFHGKLFLNSTANTFTGPITSSASTQDVANVTPFSLNSIADGVGYGNIILNGIINTGVDYGAGGTNGTGGGGAIVPLVLNNRQIIVTNNNGVLFNNSSNQAVTINTDLGFSGTGARSIQFGFATRAGSGVSTFAGKLTDNAGGAFSPTVNGGTWVFSNTGNTYTGSTTISAGTLRLGATGGATNTPLGTTAVGTTVSGTGTLDLAGFTLGTSEALTLGGTGTSSSGALTNSGGAATYSGLVSLGAAASIFSSNNIILSNLGTITGATFGLTLDGTATGSSIASSIATTTGTLTKAGTGIWTLTGANSYSGTTSINGGALDAVSGTSLPTSSILQLRGGVFQSSGTFSRTVGTATGNVNWSTSSGGFSARGGNLNLQLNGGTASVTWNASSMVSTGQTLIFGSTSADSLVDFQNGLNLGSSGTGQRTITVNDNTDSTTDIARISGAITNTVAGWGIIKDGAGRLELTNTNTYTGTTTISAGTLAVTGSLGATAVSVNAGTLAGNGNIGGSVSIASGATHALAVAATTGAQITRAITGTLTLTAGNILNLTAATTPAAGEYVLATATTAITGTPTTINYNGITGTVSVDTVSSPKRLLLTVTGGPGPVDHFAISAISSPQTVGTPITGITLTAQDASNNTAVSFTGTVTFGGTAGITGTSASFTAGVLTGVSVTPTVVGVSRTFTVDDGASHTGTTSFTVQSLYDAWATANGATGGVTGNPDSDSLTNLQEFAFGTNPTVFTSGSIVWVDGGAVTNPGLPVAFNFANPGVDYRAVFGRRKDYVAAGLTYTVEFSAELNVWVPSVVMPTVLTGAGGLNPSEVEAVSVPYPLLIDVGGGNFKKPTLLRVKVSN